jgi:hypothetical protein
VLIDISNNKYITHKNTYTKIFQERKSLFKMFLLIQVIIKNSSETLALGYWGVCVCVCVCVLPSFSIHSSNYCLPKAGKILSSSDGFFLSWRFYRCISLHFFTIILGDSFCWEKNWADVFKLPPATRSLFPKMFTSRMDPEHWETLVMATSPQGESWFHIGLCYWPAVWLWKSYLNFPHPNSLLHKMNRH